MPVNLDIPVSQLLGGLMTFVRVSGIFAFVPIPGVTAARSAAKIVMALALTLALSNRWPQTLPASWSRLAAAMIGEAALGITIGLVVALATEFLLVAFQTLSLQAGYSFASTIDPTTQADAGVLQVFAQLTSGLLFFSLGLHQQVVLAFVRSLEIHPAGQFWLKPAVIPEVIGLGTLVFSTGLRLALPVIAFLVVVDLSLALMGRINAHLQLILLAFPAKMVATLALLSLLTLVIPGVYRQFAEAALLVVKKVIAI